jgi:hypothetical protein
MGFFERLNNQSKMKVLRAKQEKDEWAKIMKDNLWKQDILDF